MKNLIIISLILLMAHLAHGNCDGIKNRTIDLVKFGAKVNDGIDDGQSIQEAFYCAAKLYVADSDRRSSVKIVFPEGVLQVNRSLTINLRSNSIQYPGAWNGGGIILVGRGAGKSILQTRSNGTLLTIYPRKAQPLITQTIEVRDLALKTIVANEGSALRIQEEYVQDTPRSHQLSINLNMQNVLIDGTAQGAYFREGIHARYLNRPVISNVKVRNSSAGLNRSNSSCLYFFYSYGVDVNHSECLNADYGINMNFVAEGDVVSNSHFHGVNTGVRMYVARNIADVPGPSNTDGKITGNTINYRRHGVIIQGKSWFTIAKNNITYQSNNQHSGVDIFVRDSRKVSVTMNNLKGSGQNRFGIIIDEVDGGHSQLTYIFKNTIFDANTGIYTSSRTDFSIIFNNTFNQVGRKVGLNGSNQQFFD